MLASLQAIPVQHTPPEQPPRRKLKYEDPIFKRRNYGYSTEELWYIYGLSPLEAVPRSYIRSLENPYPPVLIRGWIINDEIEDLLLKEAYSRNTLCIQKDPIYPEDYDYESAHPAPVPEVDIVEEDVSRDMAARAIYKELGVRFIPKLSIELVAAYGATAFALSLYTSYDLHRCPPMEDVEKVRVYFGFTSEPGWFPSALRCQWVK